MQFLNRQLQGILTILTILQAFKILRGNTHAGNFAHATHAGNKTNDNFL